MTFDTAETKPMLSVVANNNHKMENKEFAILHNLKSGQFLVDTTYDHESEEFNLSFKFWVSKMNGYATITLKWTDDKETDFIETFNKFKSVDFCEKWVSKINV